MGVFIMFVLFIYGVATIIASTNKNLGSDGYQFTYEPGAPLGQKMVNTPIPSDTWPEYISDFNEALKSEIAASNTMENMWDSPTIKSSPLFDDDLYTNPIHSYLACNIYHNTLSDISHTTFDDTFNNGFDDHRYDPSYSFMPDNIYHDL